LIGLMEYWVGKIGVLVEWEKGVFFSESIDK